MAKRPSLHKVIRWDARLTVDVPPLDSAVYRWISRESAWKITATLLKSIDKLAPTAPPFANSTVSSCKFKRERDIITVQTGLPNSKCLIYTHTCSLLLATKLNISLFPGAMRLIMVPSILLKFPQNSTLTASSATGKSAKEKKTHKIYTLKQYFLLRYNSGLLENVLFYEGVLALAYIFYNQAQCSHLRRWNRKIQCQRSSCQAARCHCMAISYPPLPPRGHWGLASSLPAHSHPSAARTEAQKARMQLVNWTAVHIDTVPIQGA